jgi:ATP-dependent Lon protease
MAPSHSAGRRTKPEGTTSKQAGAPDPMPTVKRVDDQVTIPEHLPVIALRDLVFFPYMVLPLLIGRPPSVAALAAAEEGERLLLVVAQKDAAIRDPTEDEIHHAGCVVRVVEVTRLPDGTARVVFEGVARARLTRLGITERGFAGSIELLTEQECEAGDELDAEAQALSRGALRMYDEYVFLNERVPDELAGTLVAAGDRVRLAHLMSAHLLVGVSDKQELLESPDLGHYYERLHTLLSRELEILRIEEKLDQQIRHQMDSDRRQHYLQEQLKAINKELGGGDEEWGELSEALDASKLPAQARERAERELSRLRKLNPVAPEAAVIRTYLDWILHLPWQGTTEDNLEVEHAARILDEAHYGLAEVKERILDHIAVLSLVGELKGPILCIVGPPGVGKTSIGQSIARALNREFVRVSLGGVRDEAEIRGHRRTYVGALPGRVIQGMRRSGSRNPVFLLDEVDKLASDFHGDPGAALLEVLDPEQNRAFADHYLELDFDLSDVLFVATANTLAGIPEPLRDRMEVIRIPGYLETEKRAITDQFLWPKQAARHGLDPERLSLTAEAVGAIVHRYTREAGVRELERQISRIARKLARRVASGDSARPDPVRIIPSDLKELLGPPPYLPPELDDSDDRAGISRGLAWTEAGGQVLDVEVAVVPGSGKIQLTGTLGDVMKESAFAAVTYARSRARRLGLARQFHQSVDIHIHIPEGATPKDGPSAGITIAVALISALTETPARADVAMTGEITLRGRVLPVGGVKEKTVAALRHGIRRVILPAANASELELLPEEVRQGLEFLPVGTMDDVLGAALTEPVEVQAEATPVAADLLETQESGIQLSP